MVVPTATTGHTLGEKSWLGRCILGIAKVAEANANQAKALLCTQSMRSRSDRAMVVSSSREEGVRAGVWLRVDLNSLVFSFEDHSTCGYAVPCAMPSRSFRETTDHRLGLGQRHILLEGPRQRCHAPTKLNCRYARMAYGETRPIEMHVNLAGRMKVTGTNQLWVRTLVSPG